MKYQKGHGNGCLQLPPTQLVIHYANAQMEFLFAHISVNFIDTGNAAILTSSVPGSYTLRPRKQF